MRRLLLLAGGLLTVGFVASGCLFLVDWLAVEHKTSERRFGPASTVHLDADAGGRIRVVGDGGDAVRVELSWREGLQEPTIDARLVDGRLVLRTRCPGFLSAFCRVEATVHVPAGTTVTGGGSSPIDVVDVAGPVDLDVDNGSVRVEGARGPIRVAGDNGIIRVEDSVGDVSLHTDNGAIRTSGIDAGVVDVSTSNGGIELDVATAPRTIRARTDNGPVTVLVPDDGRPWATTTATDNGNVENLLLSSPTAGRSIEARTDNGGISLRYRG